MFVGGQGSNSESNFSLSFKQTRLRVQCVSVSHCRIRNRILSSSLPIQLSCEIPVEKISKRTVSLLWAGKKVRWWNPFVPFLLDQKKHLATCELRLVSLLPRGETCWSPLLPQKHTVYLWPALLGGKGCGEKKFWKHPSHLSRRKLKSFISSV